jgi:hypothetical protein
LLMSRHCMLPRSPQLSDKLFKDLLKLTCSVQALQDAQAAEAVKQGRQ